MKIAPGSPLSPGSNRAFHLIPILGVALAFACAGDPLTPMLEAPDPCADITCLSWESCTSGDCDDDECENMTCPSQWRCVAGACVPDQPCDATTCADGCCHQDFCFTPTDGFCGLGGQACRDCLAIQQVCQSSSGTCCASSCTGKCAGTPNGCGGTCRTNDCDGCCDENLSCILNETDTHCGINGATCRDCTASGTTCYPTSHSCATPECAGRCAGAPDGLGGTCPSNDCDGCCQQLICYAPSGTVCGLNGEPCEDCAAQQQICDTDTGDCCAPSCAGKCFDADDGCGGTCLVSDCANGCCDTSRNCIQPETNTQCGIGGSTCQDCTSIGAVCSPLSHSCATPECEGKCRNALDGIGGTCPSNDCYGCCSGIVCIPPSSQGNASCGNNGSTCMACPGGQVCNTSLGTCTCLGGAYPCGGVCCSGDMICIPTGAPCVSPSLPPQCCAPANITDGGCGCSG